MPNVPPVTVGANTTSCKPAFNAVADFHVGAPGFDNTGCVVVVVVLVVGCVVVVVVVEVDVVVVDVVVVEVDVVVVDVVVVEVVVVVVVALAAKERSTAHSDDTKVSGLGAPSPVTRSYPTPGL